MLRLLSTRERVNTQQLLAAKAANNSNARWGCCFKRSKTLAVTNEKLLLQ